MTKSKRVIAAASLVICFAITAVLSMFAAPQQLAKAYGKIKEVTGEYNYDISKDFNSSVQKLPKSFNADDDIRVIVKLSADSLVESYNDSGSNLEMSDYIYTAKANDAKAKISTQSEVFLHKLKKSKIPFSVEEQYSAVISGFALTIKVKDFESFESLCSSNNATAIVSDEFDRPQTVDSIVTNDVNVYDTGIFNSSDVGYDGSGTVVAVLDSGFDYTHSAFLKMPTTLAMDYNFVSSKVKSTVASQITQNLSAADVYVNDKVPFAYDYADKDADVYPLESEHGTHVAGIIAGEDDTITGVAPGAQLALMKVFPDAEEGAPSSAILSALEDCVILGVDVINMSLGSSAGFTREEDDKNTNEIYDSIRDTGISLVVAASNSYNSTYGSVANGSLPLTTNPDSGTVGTPSTYEAALSVASISGVKTPYLEFNNQAIYYNEASNSSSKQYNFVEMMLGNRDSADFEYVTVSGFGDPFNYSGTDMTGKIALVRRGRITFEQKVQYATEAGAAGIIIYNNVSGDIRMSAGNGLKIGCISVNQDFGEMLAAQNKGTLTLSKKALAGPFMSDFSSWGPTQDLKIKPEITAHGGDILSAIPGQKYDRLSGTSMAAPNQSGVTTLVRQYVKEKFPNYNAKQVAALVNQLLMSTTDIALNEYGNPYSVRKQGAGLANLKNAVTTSAYLYVKDKDGNAKDKPKLELGDDKEKTGVYTLNFTLKNMSSKAVSYSANARVMTEGVSKTLTDSGKTTVTERAYMLGDTTIALSGSNQCVTGSNITVGGGEECDITMTLTLGADGKKYLDEKFANGMYVEGFVELISKDGGVNLDAPFLAFYGDWTKAPMFDLTFFETNPDELNNAIDEEDKIRPDGYATRPIGGLYSDYISYLGQYYFKQSPNDLAIPANAERISISNAEDSINSIYGVWAGMLRAAKQMNITITEEVTGKTVFNRTEYNQRKSYSLGASVIQSGVEVEFGASDYNLKNNTKYNVKLQGLMDYGDGGKDTNLKNTFEFKFTTDYEAPTLRDVRYYTEYDETTEKTKMFAELDVYDNHYAMSMRLGRVIEEGGALNVETYGAYMTPIYGSENSTSTITVELTDYIDQLKNAYTPNTFLVMLYDYALNNSWYEVPLPSSIDKIEFRDSNVTLSENETKTLNPLVYPSTEWSALMTYSSSNENVAKVVDGKILGVSKGTAVITARNPDTLASNRFNVTVLGKGDDGFVYFDKPSVAKFKLTGYDTIFAFYSPYSDERPLGLTGARTDFGAQSPALEMYPDEIAQLRYELLAYDPSLTTVKFTTSDPNVVDVTDKGEIVGKSKGKAGVTMTVLYDGKETYYTARVSIEVRDPYNNQGGTLASYKGQGGTVIIPERLELSTIGRFAFSMFESVEKEPWEITEEDPYFTKQAPVGEQRTHALINQIKEVYIPEGVEVIEAHAFAKLTGLQRIVLPKSLRQINNGAFAGCTALETVIGLDNVQIISQDAFNGCGKLAYTSTDKNEVFDISNTIAIGAGAFNGCGFTKVKMPKVQSAGSNAFSNCTKLNSIEFGDKIKIDNGIFSGCTSLTSMTINAPVISAEAFRGASRLQNITLGKDVKVIGDSAFAGTRISRFTVSSENTVFAASADGKTLTTVGGTTLSAVVPTLSGEYTIPSGITVIGANAFSGNNNITKITLSGSTAIENAAFKGCSKLTTIEGEMTSVGDYAFYQSALSQMPNVKTAIGRYAFSESALTQVEIASGVTLQEGAFANCTQLVSATLPSGIIIPEATFKNCAALTTVTLLGSAEIHKEAFYNCAKLSTIDLSEVSAIGAFAFSGDKDLVPQLIDISLNELVSLGKGAFGGSASLTNVSAPKLKNIAPYAFYNNINLTTFTGSAETVGEYAFMGTVLADFDFSNVTNIDAFAFAQTKVTQANLSKVSEVGAGAFMLSSLANVTLNSSGMLVNSYAFAGCEKLETVNALDKVLAMGAYAFTATGLKSISLTAQYIGDLAFADCVSLTSVTLSNHTRELGNNPFANTSIGMFKAVVKNEYGVSQEVTTFDISATVKVIDGALYNKVPAGGYELICYPNEMKENTFTVAEETVRISDYAFFGNESISAVYLPSTLKSIGHAAFFNCEKLSLVSFASIKAPALEAEFDADYMTDKNSPNGLGLIEYQMWNILYFNNFYFNNNFKNYVGKTSGLAMAFPKNGVGYNSFVYDKYFDAKIVAAAVAEDATKQVVAVINLLPENITLSDEQAVISAREAYSNITDADQRALITNYKILTDAEERIAVLKGTIPPSPEPTPPVEDDNSKKNTAETVFMILMIVFAAFTVALATYIVILKKPFQKK